MDPSTREPLKVWRALRSTPEPLQVWRALRMVVLAAIAGCASGPRPDASRALATSEAAAPPRYSVSRPADLPDELVIPLERRENRLLAAVRIDGRAAGAFVIDTGANAVVVDERLADQLALPSLTDGEIGGIHATSAASLRRLQRLSIADLELDSAPTVATPLDDLSGLIGFPALGPAPFTIDFERARLTVYTRRASSRPRTSSASCCGWREGCPTSKRHSRTRGNRCG